MKRKDGISFISTKHTMAAEQNRNNRRLTSEEWFRRNAQQIIAGMIELSPQARDKTQEDTSPLVDEILHSIFFLGKIHDPPISPESILKDDDDDDDDDDEDLLEELKSCYPGPFQLYSTQLPRRSPFSCVLDMMVKLVGQENEEEIRRRLQQFITDMDGGVPADHLSKKDIKKKRQLLSTAICVSQKSNDSVCVRHYGVSMSTSGSNAGKIMVSASCCDAWDEYVAGAVMTYCSEEKEEEEEKKKKQEKKKEKSKKSYFDGTIKIPKDVRCQTFNLRNGGKMNPCRSCGNMFGLNTYETKPWAYGNCAEVESLSNLLKKETEVKEQTQIIPDMWTPENIKRARKDVLQELVVLLSRTRFHWDGEFYTPQGIAV